LAEAGDREGSIVGTIELKRSFERLNALFVRALAHRSLAIKRAFGFCVAQECVSKHELKLEVTKMFYRLITFFDRDVHFTIRRHMNEAVDT
jgi:hypothetical protein